MLVAALADAIVPHTQGAFAIWGHSAGALVSFELARELQRRNQRGPLALIVSGRGAPQNPDEDPLTYSLPDAELLARLRGLKGTPELLNSPESKANHWIGKYLFIAIGRGIAENAFLPLRIKLYGNDSVIGSCFWSSP
jgi:surfactin synthase thioesterase subunit